MFFGTVAGGFCPAIAAKRHGGFCSPPQNYKRRYRRRKDKSMEINYIVSGDYLLPAIKLSDPPDAPPLGLYGELHKRYLREHRPILYSKLLLSEKLYPLCREIDEAARSRRKLGMEHDEIVRELVCD